MKYLTNKIPENVFWRITSRCNRKCLFCYGPETSELNTSEVIKIIKLLSVNGVKAIGITGGEPLVRPDIATILEKAKKCGLIVCLTTNADFYQKYKDVIVNCVDEIGLPVEAGDRQIHDSIRGKGNYDNVLYALDDLASRNKKIHIGTVLTEKNCCQMLSIEKLLARYENNLTYWKIYELLVYPQRKKQKIDGLVLKNSQKFISPLGKYLTRQKICFNSAQTRSRAYFLINPNGEVNIPSLKGKNTTDLLNGNLLNVDISDIFVRWHKEVDFGEYYGRWYMVKFKSLPKFITYAQSQRDEYLRKIMLESLPYYSLTQEYTQQHLVWMIEQGLGVARKEKLDAKLLIPLIILHDIGYSQLPAGSPFDIKRRYDHMRWGAMITRDLLTNLDCSSESVRKLSQYVAKHDDWALGKNSSYQSDKYLGVLNDLDFTSMLIDGSSGYMKSFLDEDDGGFIEFMRQNEKLINRPFVTQTTEGIFNNFIN